MSVAAFKININAILTAILIGSAGFFLCPTPSLAANGDSSFAEISGLNKAGNIAGYETGDSRSGVDDIVGRVILGVLSLVGVVFFLFIIYGGLIWMTADGNEEKIKRANNIIMNSLFGFILILASYGFVYFLADYLWGKI